MSTRYLRALKTALVGEPEAPLVLLCNFEAEREWGRNWVQLPAPRFTASTPMVQRMEELGLLLAGPDDYLCVKRPLDAGYRDYLVACGIALPEVLVPEHVQSERTTTEDVLGSPRLLAWLGQLSGRGGYLMPMGTSTLEARLSRVTGLPLAVPDAETFERVNSKIYGRRLVEKLGLRAVPGACCERVDDLAAALQAVRSRCGKDVPVVVKDAYGVSGKGLAVLDSERKAELLLRTVERRARRRGDPRLLVVVETWLPKRCDLNYQLTIGRQGAVRLDFVKQALTEAGVHKGHVMPVGLDAPLYDELCQAAHAVGAGLYADGYFGVVGIDAILDAGGTLYPVLEINARLNMSTYQGAITESFHRQGSVALARHFAVRLDAQCAFSEVADTLGDLLDLDRDGSGLLVTCFGTVNAHSSQPPPFEGRLYGMVFAPDRDGLAMLERRIERKLDLLGSTVRANAGIAEPG